VWGAVPGIGDRAVTRRGQDRGGAGAGVSDDCGGAVDGPEEEFLATHERLLVALASPR
jgi:hypothetical protein